MTPSDVVGPEYSRSFVSYEIPFRPDEVLDFAETEALPSYYEFFRDRAGRIVKFAKLSLVRVDPTLREVTLGEASPAETPIYFEVKRDPTTREPRVGKQLEYANTQLLSEFFAGKTSAAEKTGTVQLFRKEITFADLYEYRPTGQLQTRTMIRPGKEPVIVRAEELGSDTGSGNRESETTDLSEVLLLQIWRLLARVKSGGEIRPLERAFLEGGAAIFTRLGEECQQVLTSPTITKILGTESPPEQEGQGATKRASRRLGQPTTKE
jgi:hypothetical protein